MKLIRLVDVDRLARKRFGDNAAQVHADISVLSFAILCDSPPPLPRELPTVVIPDFWRDVEVGRVSSVGAFTVQEPRDEVQEHFAALESTRPDLIN